MRQFLSTRHQTVLLLLVLDAGVITCAVAQSPGLLLPENNDKRIFTLSANVGDFSNPLLEFGPGLPKAVSSEYSTPPVPPFARVLR